MQRWTGRVAMVTGASAGIGAAITYQLLDHGVNVIAVARRVDKVEEAVSQARHAAKSRGRYQETKVKPGKLYAKKCDVSKEEDILSLFKWIKESVGGVDILVNNAGLAKSAPISEGSTEDWRIQLDTNVLGLSICTREAVQNMRSRGVDDGHIIHISSILGHSVANSAIAMYCATKHAVMALAEGLRKDINDHKSNMKITIVSPGVVKTDFLDNMSPEAKSQYSHLPGLQSEDVADSVLYAIGTPPHVQEAVSKARQEAKTRGRYQETKVSPGKLYAKKCDVSKEQDILSLFKWIKETVGGVDILVNNAGLSKRAHPSECPTEDWKILLDTNVLGLSICTREAVQNMRSRGVNDGHIIHISSVAGHVVHFSANGMYSATKFAVLALAEGLRKDFNDHKSNMKITVVSPGLVRTEFHKNIKAGPAVSTMPALQSEDVADAVLYAIGTPPHVQIHEIIVQPVGAM